MAKQSSKTVGSLDRAATVLLLFADNQGRPLGVTEIANRLELSKAAVHRALSSFKQAGFVEPDEMSRKYKLGPSALAVGLAYLEQLDIRTLARPSLDRLSRSTGETATLSVRHDMHRIYVDQVTPGSEVKMTVPIGRPYPLHAGSSSKAFLAFLNADMQEDYLAHELELVTGRTLVGEDLRKDLAMTRKRGYARSLGERQLGAASVAAPIFDHLGQPVAVVSVCGPLERFRGKADEAASLLLVETKGLSRRLGFR